MSARDGLSAGNAGRDRGRVLGVGRRAIVVGALAAVGIGVGLAVALRESGSPTGSASATVRLAGITVSPPRQAPPLALHNYLGSPVNLANYRGRAVLVTFIYTHCPDTCPLMVSKLHSALAQMPAAERARLQIVAVSVDPRGDTRASVARFLAAREMTGRMQYLVGSARSLGAVWSDWGVGSQRDASNPELVEHTALIYGISARGKIAAVYPANFSSGEIVHDVRLLARA